MSGRKSRTPSEPDPEDRAFGRHMRSCRRARGLTQEGLAEASSLSADTIRRLEHGAFSPSLDTLRKVSGGMNMELSTLFTAFELRERDVAREVVDAVTSLSDDEQELLIRLFNVFRSLTVQRS